MTSPLARDIAEKWHIDHCDLSDLTDELAALIDARLAPVLEAMEAMFGDDEEHAGLSFLERFNMAKHALALLRPAEAKR